MREGGCGRGGGPYPAPSMRYLRDDEPPALLSLACMFGEDLKTNEKESYNTQKIEISLKKSYIYYTISSLHGDVINV